VGGETLLNNYIHSGDIRTQSVNESKIEPNLARFCPQIFLGQTPKFLDRHYEIEHASDPAAIGRGTSEILR